jgi:hypothetical protein
MAGSTGLEPAASAVTGQRSNQLNYDPKLILVSKDLRMYGCENLAVTRSSKFLHSQILTSLDSSVSVIGRYRIRTCDSRRVKPVLYH